jgi:hypothetical protein
MSAGISGRPPRWRARKAFAAAALIVVAVLAEVLGAGLRLRAGDERGQPFAVARLGVHRLRVLLVLRLLLLRLLLRSRLRLPLRIGLLLVAEIRLRLHRLTLMHGLLRRLPHVVVAIVERVVAIAFARCRWRLVVRVLLAELLLRGGDQAEVVLGVLVMVLGGDGVAGGLRIAGELQILFSDVVRGTADLHLGSVRLVDTRQGVVMVPVVALIAVASPHALVLTVSHGSPVRRLPVWAVVARQSRPISIRWSGSAPRGPRQASKPIAH